MCQKHALPGLGAPLEDDAAPVPTLVAATGSRRLRLWELGSNAHCPVIGTCLPLAVLRRIALRFAEIKDLVGDDYALHSQVVSQCAWRSPLTEAIQLELERRYAVAQRAGQRLKTEAALQAHWDAERDGAEVAAALWTCLTHPRCGGLLAKRILGEIHMRQHQLGSRDRADLARLAALESEKSELAAALTAAQARIAQLGEALATGARERTEAETRLAQAEARLRRLEARPPEREGGAPKEDPRLALQAERIRQLERALAKLRPEPSVTPPVTPTIEPSAAAPAEPVAPAIALADKAVLCVGGRPGAVPVYRKLVEAKGGRFLHHDGGTEESSLRLEASLTAADLVICQTGCISHNAYWRVKDYCRRTGKRCVFVDKPSAAGLERGLQRIAVVDDPA